MTAKYHECMDWLTFVVACIPDKPWWSDIVEECQT